MPTTVILSSARTPIGKLGGGLAALDAPELGGVAIEAALDRADVAPDAVDHVVFGQVLQAGQGQIPSRQAQIKGGIPKEVSSETINKVCASGLRAARDPRPGHPRGRRRGRRRGRDGVDVGRALPPDAGALRLPDGRREGDRRDDQRRAHEPVLRQAHGAGGRGGRRRARAHPGRTWTAGRCAPTSARSPRSTRAGWPTRSCRSPSRAARATRWSRSTRAAARHVRWSRSPPCRRSFLKDGSHTAGNAPGVNDGAGAIVVASDEWAKRNGRAALATIVAQAAVADDFPYLARTPALAATKALEKAGLTAQDIDLWEINEAFASVTLNSIRMLGRRRGEGQRERRRDRARAPDRGLRRPDPRRRSSTSSAAAAAASAAPRSAPAAARATPSSCG